jgi:hypothetical protein
MWAMIEKLRIRSWSIEGAMAATVGTCGKRPF